MRPWLLRGLTMRYARFRIAAEELPEALRLMREHDFVGCNLTVPHKIAALPLLDEVDEHARKIGAVNTVVFRAGQFVRLQHRWRRLQPRGAGEFAVDLESLRVLLLGAGGGAGRAVAYQCALENCERLVLVDRTLAKAQALAQELAASL